MIPGTFFCDPNSSLKSVGFDFQLFINSHLMRALRDLIFNPKVGLKGAEVIPIEMKVVLDERKLINLLFESLGL